MNYHLERPKVIHFDPSPVFEGDVSKLKVSFAPIMNIYEYEGQDMPNYYRTSRAEIRWTFRLIDKDKVVLSYIAEQLVVLVYWDDIKNVDIFSSILLISHFSIAAEFSMLDKPKWCSNVNPYDLEADYVDHSKLVEILISMKLRADSNK